MRKPIIAGNWKANKTVSEALTLVNELLVSLEGVQGVDMVVCPSFTAIYPVAERLKGTFLRVGAQNMHWEKSGAFTGEVTPVMLQGLVDYVILGHSERRKMFGETDETVNKKVLAALAHHLIPIIAVGETLEENEAGHTNAVVARQVRAAYEGVSGAQARGTVVAYEPVWAIGTGRAATPEGANAVHREIRAVLAQAYDHATADAIRIQYGGSMNAANALELLQESDIDGGLIGGAALKSADFTAIIKAAAQAKG